MNKSTRTDVIYFSLIGMNSIVSIITTLVVIFFNTANPHRCGNLSQLSWPPNDETTRTTSTQSSPSLFDAPKYRRLTLHSRLAELQEKQFIGYCVDNEMYSRLCWLDDFVREVIAKLNIYNVNVPLLPSTTPDKCDLKYSFYKYNDSKTLGQFVPFVNVIYVNVNMKRMDIYRTLVHETLHALGLLHYYGDEKSIMAPVIRNDDDALIYTLDVNILYNLWHLRNNATVEKDYNEDEDEAQIILVNIILLTCLFLIVLNILLLIYIYFDE